MKESCCSEIYTKNTFVIMESHCLVVSLFCLDVEGGFPTIRMSGHFDVSVTVILSFMPCICY